MEKQNLDLYLSIQKLVQDEAQRVATQVYNDLGTKFNVASVPTHTHNGVDSVPVSQKDIIQGNKYYSLLAEDTTETITIGGVYNPTRIAFYGFVANTGTSPVTKRAIINGEINFGTCYGFSDMTVPYNVNVATSPAPYCQCSNAMYIDRTDLTKNKVFTSIASFIYAEDDVGTVIAEGTVTNFNNQAGTLTISFTVGTNFVIQGALTIT